MGAPTPARSAKDWRDRVAGRAAFDRSAGEVAIRRAYRISFLREPRHVIWVKGPRDAAQAITFLRNPPRRLLRRAATVLALGAMASVGTTLALHAGGREQQSLVTGAALSAIFVWWGLTLGGWYWLPLPPGRRRERLDVQLISLGVAMPIVLAGCLFALKQVATLPADPAGRVGTLALIALIGALPGLFLTLRIRRKYRHLAGPFLKLSSSRSVADQMAQRRLQVWAALERTAVGPRADESLLLAHDVAHRNGFARTMFPPLHPFDDRLSDLPGAAIGLGSDWIAGGAGRFRRQEALRGIPRHLNGIEVSAHAASVDRAADGDPAAAFADLAFHIDRLYPFTDVAVAVEAPTAVELDAAGRPHAEGGPALVWADGTRVFAWHGQIVDPEATDTETPITRARINHEPDPGRQAVLLERYGLGRYLIEEGATETQHDACGRLYRLGQRGNEPIVAVRVTNHTPEPDGSAREFWLRVPPTTTTAREAIAWTFGLDAEEYAPVAQS